MQVMPHPLGRSTCRAHPPRLCGAIRYGAGRCNVVQCNPSFVSWFHSIEELIVPFNCKTRYVFFGTTSGALSITDHPIMCAQFLHAFCLPLPRSSLLRTDLLSGTTLEQPISHFVCWAPPPNHISSPFSICVLYCTVRCSAILLCTAVSTDNLTGL